MATDRWLTPRKPGELIPRAGAPVTRPTVHSPGTGSLPPTHAMPIDPLAARLPIGPPSKQTMEEIRAESPPEDTAWRRAYHGSSWGEETMGHPDRFPVSTDVIQPMQARYGDLGAHWAATPRVPNRFAAGVLTDNYNESPLKGEPRVYPGDIPTNLKKIDQRVYDTALRRHYGDLSDKLIPDLHLRDIMEFDTQAIQRDMAQVVFENDKDLFTEFMRYSRRMKKNDAHKIFDMLQRGEAPDTEDIPEHHRFSGKEVTYTTPRGNNPPETVKHVSVGDYIMNFGWVPPSWSSRVINKYRSILQDQGFAGIEYENTARAEVRGLTEEDRRSFITFNTREETKPAFGEVGEWRKGGLVDKPLYDRNPYG